MLDSGHDRVSLLSIYSIVRDREKVTEEVVSDKHNGSGQVIKILSPGISSADISFIRATNSVEILSSLNLPFDRVGYAYHGGHVERLIGIVRTSGIDRSSLGAKNG